MSSLGTCLCGGTAFIKTVHDQYYNTVTCFATCNKCKRRTIDVVGAESSLEECKKRAAEYWKEGVFNGETC